MRSLFQYVDEEFFPVKLGNLFLHSDLHCKHHNPAKSQFYGGNARAEESFFSSMELSRPHTHTVEEKKDSHVHLYICVYIYAYVYTHTRIRTHEHVHQKVHSIIKDMLIDMPTHTLHSILGLTGMVPAPEVPQVLPTDPARNGWPLSDTSSKKVGSTSGELPLYLHVAQHLPRPGLSNYSRLVG